MLEALANRSLIVRNLKACPAFRRCDDAAGLPFPVDLRTGELAVGWYANPAPWDGVTLVFTSDRLFVHHDGVEAIELADLLDYETPREKRTATGVRIETRTGSRFIRMAGRNGPPGDEQKFCDVWSFVQVLHMLIRTATRASAPSAE